MAEFKWHLFPMEMPEEGERDYIVMGPKGGLRLAKGFKKAPFASYVTHEFYCTKGGNGRKVIWDDEVYAWAEIPPLEVKR
jgi:hypothetical protein